MSTFTLFYNYNILFKRLDLVLYQLDLNKDYFESINQIQCSVSLKKIAKKTNSKTIKRK